MQNNVNSKIHKKGLKQKNLYNLLMLCRIILIARLTITSKKSKGATKNIKKKLQKRDKN